MPYRRVKAKLYILLNYLNNSSAKFLEAIPSGRRIQLVGLTSHRLVRVLPDVRTQPSVKTHQLQWHKGLLA